MRIMYDSLDVHAIPADAKMVLAYVDGRISAHNYSEVHARFPHAHIVTITVTGASDGASVCDVEKGDASPDHAAAWAKRKVAKGEVPTIYCNQSTLPAVKAALSKAGVEKETLFFIADPDGKEEVPHGFIAKQYAWSPGGHDYDVSAVADHWPGVDPTPKKQTNGPEPLPQQIRAQIVNVAEHITHRKHRLEGQDEVAVRELRVACERALAFRG